MSIGYTSVQWNRLKIVYDCILAAVVLVSIGGFAIATSATNPKITIETLLIRGTAISAFVLLHLILVIGPLARLDRRFLPLLYNRRHLGVAMFSLALGHAVLSTVQYHAFGDTNPLVSIFTAYQRDYDPFIQQSSNIAHFPFEPLGLVALLILFVMAATSHDFWLRNLGPSWWKTIHILVLIAYGLLVLHVAYGVLQSERQPVYPLLLVAGATMVYGLHAIAARREARADRRGSELSDDGFVEACQLHQLKDDHGLAVNLGRKRVALFRSGGRVYATSNVCRHQGGPLGEGRIVDGCVTCPWHGWEYRPEDGRSPPPFDEVIETHRVRIEDGVVFVHPDESPPGTRQYAAVSQSAATPGSSSREEFFVGYAAMPPRLARRVGRVAALTLVVVAALVGVLAASQSVQPDGVFEYGIRRSFAGVLYGTPLPMLRMTTPTLDGPPAVRNVLLVGAGKSGIPHFARGNDGLKVRFDGSLIFKQNMTMVEMNELGSFEVLGEPESWEKRRRSEKIGPMTVTGELVDTKCFLGVMRPATGKVHRACAVRCLSGGVPPGVLIRGQDGESVVLMLAGPGNRPLDFDVQWAARTVRATGHLEMHDGVAVLRVSELALVDVARPEEEG